MPLCCLSILLSFYHVSVWYLTGTLAWFCPVTIMYAMIDMKHLQISMLYLHITLWFRYALAESTYSLFSISLCPYFISFWPFASLWHHYMSADISLIPWWSRVSPLCYLLVPCSSFKCHFDNAYAFVESVGFWYLSMYHQDLDLIYSWQKLLKAVQKRHVLPAATYLFVIHI